MIKSFGILVVFFAVATALKCGTTASRGNVTASVYFTGATSTKSTFMVTIYNRLPGVVRPNDASKRITDVQAFLTPVNLEMDPSVVEFSDINGGASTSRTFAVDNKYVGNGKCVFIAFNYEESTFQKERIFSAFFELDTQNTVPVAARQIEEEHAIEARDCASTQYTFTGPSFNGEAGKNKANTWYIQSTDGTSYAGSVEFAQEGPNNYIIGQTSANGPWSVVAANTAKTGSVELNPDLAGTWSVKATMKWKCSTGGAIQTNVVSVPYYVINAKRSLDVEAVDAPKSMLSTNFAMAIAGAGVAVAAAAVVAAVVMTRRRNNIISA